VYAYPTGKSYPKKFFYCDFTVAVFRKTKPFRLKDRFFYPADALALTKLANVMPIKGCLPSL
jgi:hypothetical protein